MSFIDRLKVAAADDKELLAAIEAYNKNLAERSNSLELRMPSLESDKEGAMRALQSFVESLEQPHSHCVMCGSRLGSGQPRFCSSGCTRDACRLQIDLLKECN